MSEKTTNREKFEEQAVEEFTSAFRPYLAILENRIKVDKGSAAIQFQITVTERADGDFDITYATTLKLPKRKGDDAKGRIDNGQLVLL